MCGIVIRVFSVETNITDVLQTRMKKQMHCFQTNPKCLLNDFGDGTRKRRFEFLSSSSEVRQFDLKLNFISNPQFKAFTERIQKLTQYKNLTALALLYNSRFTLYAITKKKKCTDFSFIFIKPKFSKKYLLFCY